MAKRASPAQVRQRELAWLLFQLRGSIGNLGHILRHYKTLGPAVDSRLQVAIRKLEELDGFVQHTLARDQALREASFRPAADKPQKEST